MLLSNWVTADEKAGEKKAEGKDMIETILISFGLGYFVVMVVMMFVTLN